MPRWKLIDFDQYRMAGETLLETQRVTPRYCCPELMRFIRTKSPLNANCAMDIWSLGVIALEMRLRESYWSRRALVTDEEVMKHLEGLKEEDLECFLSSLQLPDKWRSFVGASLRLQGRLNVKELKRRSLLDLYAESTLRAEELNRLRGEIRLLQNDLRQRVVSEMLVSGSSSDPSPSSPMTAAVGPINESRLRAILQEVLSISPALNSVNQNDELLVMMRGVQETVLATRNTQLAATTGIMEIPLVYSISRWDRDADPTFRRLAGRAKDVFSVTHGISFVCCACGKEGKMYKCTQMKGWVKNVADHASTALFVLEIAGTIAGLPIPRLSGLIGKLSDTPIPGALKEDFKRTQDIVKAVQDATKLIEKVSSLYSRGGPVTAAGDADCDGTPILTPTITHEQSNGMKMLLAVLGDDTASRSGLMRVQCEWEGTWTWVCKPNTKRDAGGADDGNSDDDGSVSVGGVDVNQDMVLSECGREFKEHGSRCLWIQPRFE